MSVYSGPNTITSGRVFHFDAKNEKCFTNLARAWQDNGGNQANYIVLDNNSVILKNTSTAWVGQFPSTVSSTGRYYITFTYYCDSGTQGFTLDNDGVMDNGYNYSPITATTTPQTWSGYVDYSSTGTTNFFLRQNATGGSNIFIKNFRHFSVSSLNDISSNSRTITGTALTYGTDGSLIFNGTSSFATVSQSLSGTNSTPFTLLAWAKSPVISSNAGWQTVLGSSGTFKQIAFAGNGFYYGGNGGAPNYLLYGGPVSANLWYHMVLTYNGTTAYAYLNGVQSTGNIGGNGGSFGTNMLGSYSPLGAEYLNGSISMASIYNRALSQEEVLNHFAGTRSRFGV